MMEDEAKAIATIEALSKALPGEPIGYKGLGRWLAEKGETDNQKSGHATASESDRQRFLHSATGRFSCADIGADRNIHADEARQCGKCRANDEADGNLEAEEYKEDDE